MLAVFVSNRMLRKKNLEKLDVFNIRYSQSHIYELVSPFFYDLAEIRPKKRQSSEYKRQSYTKVVVADGHAYWITGNKLFTALMGDSGVDSDTTKEVDTFSLSKKDLSKIMFIVEKLREEDNDEGWDPRQP